MYSPIWDIHVTHDIFFYTFGKFRSTSFSGHILILYVGTKQFKATNQLQRFLNFFGFITTLMKLKIISSGTAAAALIVTEHLFCGKAFGIVYIRNALTKSSTLSSDKLCVPLPN